MLPFGLYLSAWTWLERLGGLGLVLLGLLDNSPFPVPGSMDALTVVLSAHQKDWWPYYAAMATTGGMLGAYVAYTLGRKGEQEALEKRLPRQKAEKIRKAFSKYGFWSILVPALLPPPIPFSPVPLVAGAMKYSRRKFLIAVGLARSIRYFCLAWLGSIYSEQIFGFLRQYYKAVLWAVLVAAVAGGFAAGVWIWKHRRKSKSWPTGRKKPPARAA